MATTQPQRAERQRPQGQAPGALTPESTVTLRSGREMPVLGLGSWMLTTHTAEAVMHAFELGYRMVDTSADYKTQPGIGKAIRLSPVPRESLFVSMKVEENEDGYEATARNLQELKLAYADLVLIHRARPTAREARFWRALPAPRIYDFDDAVMWGRKQDA